jgi:hypothetical protein
VGLVGFEGLFPAEPRASAKRIEGALDWLACLKSLAWGQLWGQLAKMKNGLSLFHAA